ncbi:MAG: GNAT family N-acetyltransferase [Actinomycetota bacterium]|nr:GNAT family N-acetyltransferase [Actinomycetota bacterium]
MTDPDALARIHTFERSVQEKLAERTVESRWGTYFFNDTFNRIWDLNGLRVMGYPDGIEVEAVRSEAEGMAEAEKRTPKLYVEEGALASELAPGLTAAGWSTSRFMHMVHRGALPEEIEGPRVEQVSWGTLRPLVLESTGRQPYAQDPEDRRQLVDRVTALADALTVVFFMGYADGVPASYCHLYSDGDTAQIEEVATLSEYRGRGLATVVVAQAMSYAAAAGHDFIYLVADADDWPKDMYAKLGFEPVGYSQDFYKRKEGKLTNV